jgi:hypothetical protein
VIPFKVPEAYLTDVAAGALRRIGTTLRDTQTGRIVAHLQETGTYLAKLGAGNPAGLLLGGGNLASSLAANRQLEQVKSMLSGLQMLGAATLAASVVGVGVSAAGFALVLRRLAGLEGQVRAAGADALAARVAAERVEAQWSAAQRALVEHLLGRAEEAWERSDAVSVWREVEGPLDLAQCYWRHLVAGQGDGGLFLDPRFEFAQAAAAYEAVLVLAHARVQVLLLLEERRAARRCLAEALEWHGVTVLPLEPERVAAARARALAGSAGLRETDARLQLLRHTERFKATVREVHLNLGTAPELVADLERRGISGREYVEAIRGERERPLLLLPAG